MADICNNCPMRLFNEKHYNLQGIGNPFCGKVIVVPNVDYDAYKLGDMTYSHQVSLIQEVLGDRLEYHHSSKGVELSNLYILPLIRCNEQISCPVDNISYNRCLHLFANDVRTYDFKDILLLGEAARRFLSVDALKPYLDTIFVSKGNKRRYAVNYSPLIKHTGEYHYDIFKENLIKWFNFTIEHDYSQYNVKMI